MKKLLILLTMGAVIVLGLISFGSHLIAADIPHLINYQGMLTNNLGDPLNGTPDITFEIWNAPSGGTRRWWEIQSNVPVENGLFNVILGQVTPIDLSFYQDANYWLQIIVEEDTMPSRLKFTSVAFAYRAQKSDTASYAMQVESYPHHHDAAYVNVIGPDSVVQIDPIGHTTALAVKAYGWSDVALWVKNSGSWCCIRPDAIQSRSDWGCGLYIDSAGAAGIRILNVGDDGIHMDDVHQDGIYMEDVAGDGIRLNDVEGYGIWINDANSDGLYIKLADNGVYIDSTRSGFDGIYINYSEDDGITVSHADDEGLYVAEAGGYGIWAHGDDGNLLESEDAANWGLRVYSYTALSTNPGLKVWGYGEITGTWSTKFSTSSGDAHAFMVTSRDVELIASGTGTLVNGKAQVTFEQEFQEAISTEVPIRVVVTAQDAPSALLYVTNKSTQGFTVKPLEIPELSLKTNNVSFDWIAIGRQKGYEQRPEILIPSEEEQRAEELKEQEELKQNALYREQMLEKQARREAEREQREREEQERGELE